MRLTCPNCGAQYEVPDQVIPREGRDVQCSNCGNTWFCAHPDFAPASQDDPKSEADRLRDTIRDLSEPSDPERRPRPRPAPKPRPDPDETQAPRERRNLDPEIADILREEARHEAELREAEARNALETQPDLGLDTITDDAERRAEQARQRMARLRGQPVDPPAAPKAAQASPTQTLEQLPRAAEPAAENRPTPPRQSDSKSEEPRPVSRKEMLPDIEEISSSLRQSDQGTDYGKLAGLHKSPRHKAGGFTRGFAVAIIIAAVLLMIYTNAPAIADMLPEADPMLSAFVAMVDQGRFWLQETIRNWN